MSTAFLNISNNWLLDTATHFFLPKAFHDSSATFTTVDFDCMVCLKKSRLKKLSILPEVHTDHRKNLVPKM